MHNYLKFKSCYKKTMKNAKPECVLRFHMLQQHWMPCRNSDSHHWKTLKNKSTSRTRIFAPNPSKTMRRQNPKIRGNYKPVPSFHKVAKNLLIINLKNAFPVFSKVAQGLQGGTCRTPAIPRPPSLTDVCFLPLGTEFSSHVWHSEDLAQFVKAVEGYLVHVTRIHCCDLWPRQRQAIYRRFTARARSHPSRFEHLILSSACATVSPFTYLVNCCI